MSEVEKEYPLEELYEHCDQDSAWLLINDKFYDVTKWLDEHPGGPDVLLGQTGSDATEAFQNVGHTEDAEELMKKYQIGKLKQKVPKALKVPQVYENSSSDNQLLMALVLVAAIILGYLYFGGEN